jgi:hypothetical protein
MFAQPGPVHENDARVMGRDLQFERVGRFRVARQDDVFRFI